VPRPLTHDLMLSVISELRAELDRIEIHDLREGTFYARLILRVEGGELIVDARPSDAIGIAVRAACPVFIAESVVEEAGISINLVAGLQVDSDSVVETVPDEVVGGALARASSEGVAMNLRSELEKAVADEDYERAAAIRDKLKELEG
jgi:uncharacterized protein